jgi:magnesium transporter
MGGNTGTQALTVTVRALAQRQVGPANVGRVVLKEVGVGALNGIGFAVLMGAIAGFWFQDSLLGIVMAAAIVINLVTAGLAGAAVPLVLHRVGVDPAIAASVFLTAITDVVGFFAFLGLGTWLLL